MRRKACLGVSLFLIIFSAEFSFWLGARAARPLPPAGSCAVLALGYPSRANGRLSAEQRDRVASAVRVALDFNCDPVVFSGGAVRNEFSEAATMALEAVRRGLPRARIRIEGEARSTVENARLSAPKLRGTDTVYVVSNGLHAHRGTRDLCREAPDLCAKARPAAYYYPLRRFWLKFPAALHEFLALLKEVF